MGANPNLPTLLLMFINMSLLTLSVLGIILNYNMERVKDHLGLLIAIFVIYCLYQLLTITFIILGVYYSINSNPYFSYDLSLQFFISAGIIEAFILTPTILLFKYFLLISKNDNPLNNKSLFTNQVMELKTLLDKDLITEEQFNNAINKLIN